MVSNVPKCDYLNSECACTELDFVGIKVSINVTLSGDWHEFQQTLLLKKPKMMNKHKWNNYGVVYNIHS